MTPARRPHFLRFILTGAVIGFAIGGALAVGRWFEDTGSVFQGQYPESAGIGYLGFLGAALCAILAALLAILLDRRADRR